MGSKDSTQKTINENSLRRSSVITIVSDVVLLLAFVVCLLAYISKNNIDTYDRNLETLSNTAAANSQLIQAALDNASYEVLGAYNYCDGKSVDEILDYLSLITEGNGEYQLLRRDANEYTALYHVYSGYSTKKDEGGYIPVIYKDTSLASSLYNHSVDEHGVVRFSQSFTNDTDALRYFAVFCALAVAEEDGEECEYFLVRPQKEALVISNARAYSKFNDLSTALCYTDGKFLAHDNGFRSDNFFDYLYDYNGLSADERNAVRDAVRSDEDGAGVLTYKDYKQRDCVFAYAACGVDNEWLVIAAVPAEEFTAEETLTAMPLMIIAFLVILLSFNIYRLLAMVRELRQSVRREKLANASKSSFLSRMSHEIRTPLNAVIGYNNIARNELSRARGDSERRAAEMKTMDCLDKSGIASQHLLGIINDVLDMSAIDSGKVRLTHERFDFKGLITSLTTVFYSQARAKGVDFQVLLDTLTEEWFVGDQMRVNQILTNLLSNAVKFTSEGGRVTMRVRQPEAEENAAHLRFDITDTGIGMTQEYLTHIWTPFEQADSSISRRFGGTGLGLSITKNLVELMDGDISVESAAGVGTTFHVDLTFERTEQPAQGKTYDFTSVNALAIDDDPGALEYIRMLFNRCGARCETAASGEEGLNAVSLANDRGEPFTVCLVDWQMPHMDGIETIRRMRQLLGDKLPIVVLSAYDYTELADKAAEVGVSSFLSKPFFQSSLVDLLADFCGKSKAEPEPGTSYDFTGKRVLLAEDNNMNMEIAKNILRSTGLEIYGVWNGKQAVEAFTASVPGTYAAVLMDVHMPEMDGHEATRAIRASSHPEAASIPIIAMTADAFAENVAEAIACGMNDHVAKPIDPPTLFWTLAKYI